MSESGTDSDTDSDNSNYEYESDDDSSEAVENPSLNRIHPSHIGEAYDIIKDDDDKIEQLTESIVRVTIATSPTNIIVTCKLDESNFKNVVDVESFNYYPTNMRHMLQLALEIFVNRDLDKFLQIQSRIERKKAEIVTERTTKAKVVAGGAGGAGGAEGAEAKSPAPSPDEEFVREELLAMMLDTIGITDCRNPITRLYMTLRWIIHNRTQLCPICCHKHETVQEDLFPCQNSAYCIWQFSQPYRNDMEYLMRHRKREVCEMFVHLYNLFRSDKPEAIREVLSEFEDDLFEQIHTLTSSTPLVDLLADLKTLTNEHLNSVVWAVYAKSTYRLVEIDPLHFSATFPIIGAESRAERHVEIAFKIARFMTPQLLKAIATHTEAADLLHTTYNRNVHSMLSNGGLIFSGTSRQATGAACGIGFYMATTFEFVTRYMREQGNTFVVHALDMKNPALYNLTHYRAGQAVAKDTSKLTLTYVFRRKYPGEHSPFDTPPPPPRPTVDEEDKRANAAGRL